MRRSVVWIPFLLVGSMMYWALALGLGGLSLMTMTSEALPCGEGLTRDGFQSITVNLGDSLEPPSEETDSLTVDLISDHDPAHAGQGDTGGGPQLRDEPRHLDRNSGRRPRSDRGPGETAF